MAAGMHHCLLHLFRKNDWHGLWLFEQPLRRCIVRGQGYFQEKLNWFMGANWGHWHRNRH